MARMTARLATAGLTGALIISPALAPSAFAASAHHPAKAAAMSSAAQSHASKSHASKARHIKKAKFTASGVVTAVDLAAGTLTIADKGGSKDLHGMSVTITVDPAAVIERDDAVATLADIAIGDQVSAGGTRSDGPTYTAVRISAESPEADDADDDSDDDGSDA